MGVQIGVQNGINFFFKLTGKEILPIALQTSVLAYNGTSESR